MIQKDADWPPEESRQRISGYKDYRALYEGRHKDVAEIDKAIDIRIAMQGSDILTYLVHDLPRLVVNIPVNLLISKSPVVSYPTETDPVTGEERESKFGAALHRIMKRSKIQATILEHVQDTSILGDGVLLVTGDKGSAKIEAKPAYCYFPTQDPDDAKSATQESLAWEREWDGDKVIRVDRYVPGYIVREAYKKNGDKVGERLPDEVVEEMTGMPALAAIGPPDANRLIHVANNPSTNSYFGQSDLGGGLPSLFDEVNERASQIARILDKHAAPKLAGPAIYQDPKGRVQLEEYIQTVDGEAPKYITWDAQLQAAFMHLDRVVENLFACAEVSKALAYMVQGARYDSAPAAQMTFAQTLAKTARKRLYHDYGLKEAFQIAVAVELGMRYEDVPEPNIRWRDGLPKDMNRDALTEEIRLRSGTTSLVDAIRRLDDCDEKTARQTIIEQEKLGSTEPAQNQDPATKEPAEEPALFMSGSEETA